MRESTSESPNTGDKPPRKRWRQRVWWVRYLVYLGGVVVVLSATYAVLDVRGRMRWKAFAEHIEASGSSLDIRELVKTPATSDSFWNDSFIQSVLHENHPRLNLNYDSILTDDGEFDIQKNRVIRLTWYKSQLAPLEDFFPNLSGITRVSAAQRILAAMGPFEAVYPDLQNAIQKSASGFPVEALSDREILEHHAGTVADLGDLCQLRIICLLAVHRRDEAADQILTLIRLANHIEEDAISADWYQAQSLKRYLLQPVWEGLRNQIWDEEQLRKLDISLAQVSESGIDFETLLEKERWRLTAQTEQFTGPISARSNYEFFGAIPGWRFRLWTAPDWIPDNRATWSVSEAVNQFMVSLVPKGVFQQNPIYQDRVFRETLLDPTLSLKQRIDAEESMRKALANDCWCPPSVALFLQVNPPMGPELKFALETRQWLDTARAAVAAERYFIKKGRYPKSWNELVPEWLSRVPDDIWSGGKLIYSFGAQGRPIIYSVGVNEADDGGAPRYRVGNGDLVWRYSLPPEYQIGKAYNLRRKPNSSGP